MEQKMFVKHFSYFENFLSILSNNFQLKFTCGQQHSDILLALCYGTFLDVRAGQVSKFKYIEL